MHTEIKSTFENSLKSELKLCEKLQKFGEMKEIAVRLANRMSALTRVRKKSLFGLFKKK